MLVIDGLLGNRYRWFGRSEACRVPTPDVSGPISSPNRGAARTRRSGDDPAYAIDAGDGRKVTRIVATRMMNWSLCKSSQWIAVCSDLGSAFLSHVRRLAPGVGIALPTHGATSDCSQIGTDSSNSPRSVHRVWDVAISKSIKLARLRALRAGKVHRRSR